MERPVPFISRVRLKNFKSIAECDVRLGPLTVLTGPNGSGKSSFLQALALLGRAVSTTPEEAIAELGGLSAIVRRVPEPAESFSIDIEAAVPRGPGREERAPVSYGFGIGAARGGRAFEVLRETCQLRWAGRGWRFEADHGAVHDESPGSPVPALEPGRLYLSAAGTRAAFAPVLAALAGIRSYSFALDTLRQPSRPAAGAVLGSRGEHLGDVLSALAAARPDLKDRIDAYLHAVTPGIKRIDARSAGGYMTVAFRASNGSEFGPDEISDGTIHAAAVLAALFQPAASDGRIPLTGIDNPETTLHPAATAALLDALTEASEHAQVIVTTQSPDLLDREDLDASIARAVSMNHGLTVIGKVDRASQRIISDGLCTLGELMRGSQLSPEPRARATRPQA